MKKTKEVNHKIGRPTIFTKELGTLICDRLSKGESLRSICRDDDMPDVSSVIYWLLDADKKEFLAQYRSAREVQTELMFEELAEIADETPKKIVGDDKSDSARVNANKLRVDTKKWILSKMSPRKYGDKLDVTTDGKSLPHPIYGGNSDNKPKV